jgi:hypothetical protein
MTTNVFHLPQVLYDEKLRDVYNRFGEQSTDPRLDEFALIIHLVQDALFWALVAFVVTIPRGSKGCRTWMILSLITMIIFSVVIQLSDATLPDFEALGLWPLAQLTEFELLVAVERFVPYLFMIFVMLSEYYYVDTEAVTASALEGILTSHQEINKLLRELQEVVAHPNSGEESVSLDRSAVEKKLGECKAAIGESNASIGDSIDALRQQGGGVGETYHWIVFALIYGGAYIVASS